MGKLKKITVLLFMLAIAAAIAMGGICFYVTKSTENRILYTVESEDIEAEPAFSSSTEKQNNTEKRALSALRDTDADCILVLGASVRADGTPSPMLRDRLNVGIALYHQGIAPKLLLSGDHGQAQYDEVNVMKDYAEEQGVPSKDIFLDHAGFSTYESVYRARDIFQVERMVIVTQKYHQYRALYNARRLDVEAWGVAADQKQYRGQSQRNLREVAAQIKDFAQGITKPEPTYLGEAIPISGSGLKSQE